MGSSPTMPTMNKKDSPYTPLWSPALAYAVGLLVTDGSLSVDGRHIILTSKDIDQINTFQHCIGTSLKIGITKNPRASAFRVQIGDVKLYRWLLTIGLSVRKTYSLGVIDIPYEYFIDFLRGHLDGDGSITTYTDASNASKNKKYVYTRIWVRFISASKPHLDWLQREIISHIGITGRLHTVKPTDTRRVPMYILKFGKKESLKLFPALYYSPNVPALERKRVIAELLMEKFSTNK